MFSKKSLTAILLTLTLLLAPAALAAPDADAELGWMGSVSAFFVGVVDLFTFDLTAQSAKTEDGTTDDGSTTDDGTTDDGTTDDGTALGEPILSTQCGGGGKGGAFPDPNGCV